MDNLEDVFKADDLADIKKEKKRKRNIFLGKIIRIVFIIIVGVSCYNIIPTGIFSTPISNLTLGDITSLMFGFFLTTACIGWFFGGLKSAKYELWGKWGFYILLVVVFVSIVLLYLPTLS